jgi:diguanylate cyclase (GGDEF)-like protein
MARLAYSERRRSRILEQINGVVPLAEIVEQTAELVSFRLQGAACWVHIEGGASLGNAPKNLAGFRVVEMPIPSRSGQPAGTLYAATGQRAVPGPVEKETLSMAAGLIELAIETRKTYTDLVHRSEFDQLTNVQNRFALERSLDQQIRQARASAGIFALIYIDLNDFKRVNDLYGHQVGDRLLQEISLRMKRQLRPGDLLARLGGDEFAVLVPEIRNRIEVEEIAQRLEHCFDAPFQAEEYTIKGSAAIGFALYPEDGRNRETLLRSADTAMYEVKHTREPNTDAPSENAPAAS